MYVLKGQMKNNLFFVKNDVPDTLEEYIKQERLPRGFYPWPFLEEEYKSLLDKVYKCLSSLTRDYDDGLYIWSIQESVQKHIHNWKLYHGLTRIDYYCDCGHKQEQRPEGVTL